MFQVETFQDPVNYFSRLSMERGEVHLTGSRSLCTWLAGRKTGSGQIMTYSDWQDELFPVWNAASTTIYLAAQIRSVLDAIDIPERMKESLLRDMAELVESVRFAAELGVSRLMERADQEERTKWFCRLYNELATHSGVAALLAERAGRCAALPDHWRKEAVHSIYVYQMNHLDALKMVLFHQCQISGVRIVFRIPDLEEARAYTAVNPWETVYTYLQRPHQWARQDSVAGKLHDRGKVWLEWLSGTWSGREANDQKLLTAMTEVGVYSDPMVLQQEFERAADTYTVAFSYRELNESFRYQGVPDMKTSPSILAHPQAKFLYFLYECKIEDGEVVTTYDTFVECVVSGWIFSRHVSGTRAAEWLYDLVPYMEGVRTFTDIRDRLEALTRLLDASQCFDEMSSQHGGGNSTVMKYLANPLRAFPYVRVEDYAVTVKQLMDLALDFERKVKHVLPEEGEGCLVQDHFQHLRQLWHQVKPQLMSSADDHIIRRLDQGFGVPLDDRWQWSATRHELKQAVWLTVAAAEGGDFSEEDVFLSPEQLEGLLLGEQRIHFTDFSDQSIRDFLRRRSSLPGYLDHTLLKLSLAEHEEYSVLLRALVVDFYSRREQPAFLQHQLFQLLNYFPGAIRFSWIQSIHEHDIPHYYYRWLATLYGEQDFVESTGGWLEDVAAASALPDERESACPMPDFQELRGKLPTLYWLDADECYKKFMFTAILQKQPMYNNDFHQRMAFATLASLFSQQAEGREKVRQWLFPLFPQWTLTTKSNLLQTAYYRELRHYAEFDGVWYPKAMRSLQKLRSRFVVGRRYKVSNAYREDRVRDELWLEEFGQAFQKAVLQGHWPAEPGEHCMMCAFQNRCPEGEFAVDGRG